jgi:RNA polymerase sigma factor (sigma-70 family)
MRSALRRCGQWHLAQDFVQEAFLRLWKAWPSRHDTIVQVRAYSDIVLKNAINDYYRQQHIQVALGVDPEDYDLDWGGLETPDNGEIHRAIRQLPDQQREVVYLHDFDGLSMAEIAARMKIAEKTARNYHATAKKRLKKSLSQPPMKALAADSDRADKEVS